ncbi:MAG TPA: hypothetical protein PJ982_03475, partial [Lacipirellulaceae bacterium]|nr:hypothetical protein [Lacipirellulaceae bacterium]
MSGQIGPDELWTALQSAQRFAQQWHERPNVAYGGGRIEGDVSQVLLHVLTEVAGAAMRQAASRGIERRAP